MVRKCILYGLVRWLLASSAPASHADAQCALAIPSSHPARGRSGHIRPESGPSEDRNAHGSFAFSMPTRHFWQRTFQRVSAAQVTAAGAQTRPGELRGVQRGVGAVGGEQLVVGALLDDRGRPPSPGSGRRRGSWTAGARSRSDVRSVRSAAIACCSSSSVRVSTELVASSRISSAGSARNARAMVTSCRSPALMLRAVLVDDGVVAVGQGVHEPVHEGRRRRREDLLLGGVRAGRRRCCRGSSPRTARCPAAPCRSGRAGRRGASWRCRRRRG